MILIQSNKKKHKQTKHTEKTLTIPILNAVYIHPVCFECQINHLLY